MNSEIETKTDVVKRQGAELLLVLNQIIGLIGGVPQMHRFFCVLS